MVAFGSVGDLHIQEKIGVLDPRSIWLDHAWGTLFRPQGVSTEMSVRNLVGSTAEQLA